MSNTARIGHIATSYEQQVEVGSAWDHADTVIREVLRKSTQWQKHATYFRERFPSWPVDRVSAAATEALSIVFPIIPANDLLRLSLFSVEGILDGILHGQHGTWTTSAPEGEKLILNFGSVKEEGETSEEPHMLEEVARRSMPSIRCTKCNAALGVRLPSGPQGEISPLVYVRGGKTNTSKCHPLWWTTLADKKVLCCTYTRLNDVLATFSALAYPDNQKHLDECDAHELHHEVESIRSNSQLVSAIEADWLLGFGVANLVKWKNSAMLDTGTNVIKVCSPHLALSRAKIPYFSRDGDRAKVVHKDIRVIVDSVPLLRGTRGRCPDCGQVQPIK